MTKIAKVSIGFAVIAAFALLAAIYLFVSTPEQIVSTAELARKTQACLVENGIDSTVQVPGAEYFVALASFVIAGVSAIITGIVAATR